MLDRNLIMQLLASVPESTILQALANASTMNSQGASGGDQNAFAMMDDQSNQMESYNNTMVTAPGIDRPRPPLFSGENFIQQRPGNAMSNTRPMAPPPSPYMDPGYSEDMDQNQWLALQQSGGMA